MELYKHFKSPYEPSEVVATRLPYESKEDRNLDRFEEGAKALNAGVKQTELNLWKDIENVNVGMNSPQDTFDAFFSLGKGSNIAVWDIESIGTANHHGRFNEKAVDFFSITEIALKKVNYSTSEKVFGSPKGEMSLLIRPDKSTADKLEIALNALESGGYFGLQLNDDLRRSLSALAQYGGDAKIHTVDGRTVLESHGSRKIGKGSSLAKKENISLMRSGLKNLMGGTPIDDALMYMNGFLSYKTVMAGHNVHMFDQPVLREAIGNRLAKHNPGGKIHKALSVLDQKVAKPQIDTLELVRGLEKNPYTKFGKNLRLGNIFEALGKGSAADAHFALADIGMNMDILKEGIGMLRNNKALVTMRENVVKTGDVFTSKRGMTKYQENGFNPAKGRYDAVYKKVDGKYILSDSFQNTPLLKGANYTVVEQFDDLLLGEGKKKAKHAGVLLRNEDTGYFHFFARERKSELGSLFQEFLQPVTDIEGLKKTVGKDRARRAYDRLFSMEEGNGYRGLQKAYRGIDLYQEALSQNKTHEEAVSSVLDGFNKGKDPTYHTTRNTVENIIGMSGRLNEERSFWEQVMSINHDGVQELEQASLHRARTLLDGAFDPGQEAYGYGDTKNLVLSGRFGEKQLDLTNPGSFKGGLKNLLSGQKSLSGSRRQIDDVLTSLKNQGLLSPEEVSTYRKQLLSELKDGGLSPNFQVEFANVIRERAIQNGSYTTTSMGLRISPSGDTERGRFLKGLNEGFGQDFMSEVLSKAEEQASAYVKPRGPQGKLLFTGNAKKAIEKHDAVLKGLYDRAGLSKRKGFVSAQEQLEQVLSSFRHENFATQLRFNEEQNKFELFFSDAKDGKRMAGMTYEELRNSRNIGYTSIGLFNENGSIAINGQRFTNRFFASVQEKTGAFKIEDVFGQTMEKLRYSPKRIREKYNQKGENAYRDYGMNLAENHIRRGLTSVGEGLIANNGSRTSDSDFGIAKSSVISNTLRGTQVDITGTVQDWYAQKYGKSMEVKSGKTAFNSLSMAQKREFLQEAPEWMREFGLDLHYNGVNDKQASSGVLTGYNIQEISPFGDRTPLSRENAIKAPNTRALNRGDVEAKMREQGYSNDKIARFLNSGSTTEDAFMWRGDELSHLQMRTALSNDAQLKHMFQKGEQQLQKEERALELKKGTMSKEAYVSERARIDRLKEEIKKAKYTSVHDGMMVMASDYAPFFETKIQGSVQVADYRDVPEALKGFLNDHMGEGFSFDENTSVKFTKDGKGISAEALEKALGRDALGKDALFGFHNGKYELTVGDLAKEDVGDASGKVDSYKKHHKNFELIGYDANDRRFHFQETTTVGYGTKAISEHGDRHTFSMISREMMDLIGFKGVDAIMPEVEYGKQFGGNYIHGKIDLYRDELLRQMEDGKPSAFIQNVLSKEKLTVSDLSKAETKEKVMNAYLQNVTKHTGLEGRVDGLNLVFKNGQSSFGGENSGLAIQSALSGFTQEMDTQLGVDFSNRSYDMKQVKMGVHDVTDHEHTGKVLRFGRKEQQVIEHKYGKESEYAKFISNQIKNNGKLVESKQLQEEFSRFYYRRDEQYNPTKGDVVLDFTGSVTADDSENNVFSRNGAKVIDGNTIKGLPDRDKLTVGQMGYLAEDYAGTIMNVGSIRTQRNSQIQTAQDLLGEKGSYYVKMPEIAGVPEHVQWLDFSRFRQFDADEMMIREAQKAQTGLFHAIQEVESFGTDGVFNEKKASELQDKVRTKYNAYLEQVDKFYTGSHEGGFQRMLNSTKVEHSGSFRAQVTNPFYSYEKKDGVWKNTGSYKENTMYLSRERMGEMIQGMERNIAESIYGEEAGSVLDRFKKKGKVDYAGLRNQILDDISMDGNKALYGNSVRFPVIQDSTLQAVAFKVDDGMSGDRTAKMTIGTLKLMAGDADGDTIYGMLTHYKEKNATSLHRAVETQYNKEVESGMAASKAQGFLQDYEENLIKGYEHQLIVEQKEKLGDRKMSNAQLFEQIGAEKQDFFRQKAVEDVGRAIHQGDLSLTMKTLNFEGLDAGTAQRFFELKTSSVYDELTMGARMGKGVIGSADNFRESVFRLWDLYKEDAETLGLSIQNVESKNKSVQSFFASLSQELISSKKLSANALIEEGQKIEGVDAHEYARQKIRERTATASQVVEKMKILSNDNISEVHALLDSIGIAGGDTRSEALTSIVEMNTAYRQFGGLTSSSLAIDRSTGIREARSYLQDNRVLMTNELKETIGGIEEMQGFIQAGEERRLDGVRKALGNTDVPSYHEKLIMNQTNNVDKLLAQGGETLIDQAIERRGSMGKSLKGLADSVAGTLMSSKGASAFAGFGALWGMSALMRKGPTPEGMQEQQQASQTDVAPSALLTSPTARVTSNAENIVLKVQARGGNPNDVAGMINQEIAGMTGMSMDMNVYNSDNLQNIDQQWLQQTVNRAISGGFAF